MHIDLIPTLIDQYRETFEGEVTPGWVWIVDGPPESAIFGTIAPLAADPAFRAPAPGARSVAAHVAHLRYAQQLTLKRLRGEDPKSEWQTSFDVPPASEETWKQLQRELRAAYEAVVQFLQSSRGKPITEWPPINVAGMNAMTAHNAYHLSAIRQIIRAQQ